MRAKVVNNADRAMWLKGIVYSCQELKKSSIPSRSVLALALVGNLDFSFNITGFDILRL